MQKTTNIKGFCPYFNEDVTIKASFSLYRTVGASEYATPQENLCKHRFECGRDADPDNCPIFNQAFLWNKL